MWLYLFIALFTARYSAELFIQPRKPKNPRSPAPGKKSLAVLVLGHLASAGAVDVGLYFDAGKASALLFPGFALFLAGFAGRVLSLRSLGAGYSRFVEAPAEGGLVTTGMYAKIRHPIYGFYLLEMIGILLVRPNVVSAACFAAVAAAALYRIRWEESVLAKAFGEKYADYKRHTKKLIPGIY